MTQNIIVLSVDHNENHIQYDHGFITKKYSKMCLGHEIHMSRFVLFDMLVQNVVSINDIIVTLKDRLFLYTKIFPNCIDDITFMNMDKTNYNIINLSLITGSDIHVNRDSIYETYNHKVLDKFYSPEFKLLLNNIDFCEINYDNNYNKDYIVIHHRYHCNIDFLIQIIEKLNEKNDVNIIIFNNNNSFLEKELQKYNNLIFIDNLQLYASFLNSYKSKYKCKLFISEWSGGGQLSHYTYDGKVMYYFNHYQCDIHYVGHEKLFLQETMSSDFRGPHWDFKHSRNIDMNMFKNINDLLENI
jgi:hypothetical protein